MKTSTEATEQGVEKGFEESIRFTFKKPIKNPNNTFI